MVMAKQPGRQVLITGASSGIGAATVRAMTHAGWSVIAVARRKDPLEALATETGCDIVVADITKQSDREALVEYVQGAGGISALVNNAGAAFGSDAVAEASADDWLGMLELNVVGTQQVIKALIAELRAGATREGVADIVTISSTAAFISYEGGGGYNAAKAGVHAMLGALRLELAGEPIRVVEIAPGMVKTDEFTLKRFGGDEKRTEALYEGVENPLVAEDVADVVRYALTSPAHVNLDLIQMKPVAQAMQYKLHRGPLKPKI
jgi:NADP-dependent 3-hydroxy acid dehydrogenase YdfG